MISVSRNGRPGARRGRGVSKHVSFRGGPGWRDGFRGEETRRRIPTGSRPARPDAFDLSVSLDVESFADRRLGWEGAAFWEPFKGPCYG